MNKLGTLYVIATPIGNLADITLRALDIIKKVQVLYAEDTRVTQHLLDHYGIQAKLEALHDFNESKKIASVIKRLQAGQDLGLVSDAGTPLISDPGYKLITAINNEDIPIRPIPGASALTAALSVAGVPTGRFIFEGFLPKSTSERSKLFKSLCREPRAMVFYESPKRILAAIQDCIEVIGGERQAVVLRELTKHYEQHIRGNLNEILLYLKEQREQIRGEIVLILQGNSSSFKDEDIEKATYLLTDLQQHLSHKDAVAIVSKHMGVRRNQLYSRGLGKGEK